MTVLAEVKREKGKAPLSFELCNPERIIHHRTDIYRGFSRQLCCSGTPEGTSISNMVQLRLIRAQNMIMSAEAFLLWKTLLGALSLIL